MKKETNPPPPIHAFAESQIGLEISTEATAQLSPMPAKPPRPPFIDRNLKAGKFVLKEGTGEAVWEIIKWLVSGRKREPAIA